MKQIVYEVTVKGKYGTAKKEFYEKWEAQKYMTEQYLASIQELADFGIYAERCSLKGTDAQLTYRTAEGYRELSFRIAQKEETTFESKWFEKSLEEDREEARKECPELFSDAVRVWTVFGYCPDPDWSYVNRVKGTAAQVKAFILNKIRGEREYMEREGFSPEFVPATLSDIQETMAGDLCTFANYSADDSRYSRIDYSAIPETDPIIL